MAKNNKGRPGSNRNQSRKGKNVPNTVPDDVVLDSKFFSEIRSAANRSDKILERLRKRMEENLLLTAKEVEYLGKNLNARKEVETALRSMVKMGGDIAKAAEEQFKQIEDQIDLLTSRWSLEKSIYSTVMSGVEALRAQGAAIGESATRSGRQLTVQDQIRQAVADTKDTYDSYLKALTATPGVAETSLNVIQDQLRDMTRLQDLLTFAKAYDGVSGLEGQVAIVQKQARELMEQLGMKLNDSTLQGLREVEEQLLQEVKLKKAALAVTQRKVKVDKDMYSAIESANNRIEGQMDRWRVAISFIPGIGKDIAGRLDDIKESITESVTELGNAARTGSSMGTAISNSYRRVSNAIFEGNSGLKLGKGLAAGYLALILATGKNALDHFIQLGEAAKSTSQATGLSVRQSYALAKNALNAVTSSTNQLSVLKDIVDVQDAMVSQYGRYVEMQPGVTAQISDTAKSYGYSADEAGKLQASIMALGATSPEYAGNLQVATAELAEANKIAPGLIAKDLINNSALLARNFAGMPKQAAKAAIEIRKMGYNLEAAGKVQDHLFQVESSLTAQMEASVGLNRFVDVSKARQLGLEGKISEMMAEISFQAGTYTQFMDMNVAQRMLIANATGLEISELQKGLYLQQFRNDFTEDELALITEKADQFGNIEKMSGEQLKVRLHEVQAQEALNAQMAAMKGELAKALLPYIETFAGILIGILPVLRLIGKAIRILLWPVEMVGNMINGFFGTNGSFQNGIKGIGETFSNVFGGMFQSTESWWGWVKDGFKIVLGIAGAILSANLAIVGGGKLISGIIGMFTKGLTGLGKAVNTVQNTTSFETPPPTSPISPIDPGPSPSPGGGGGGGGTYTPPPGSSPSNPELPPLTGRESTRPAEPETPPPTGRESTRPAEPALPPATSQEGLRPSQPETELSRRLARGGSSTQPFRGTRRKPSLGPRPGRQIEAPLPTAQDISAAAGPMGKKNVFKNILNIFKKNNGLLTVGIVTGGLTLASALSDAEENTSGGFAGVTSSILQNGQMLMGMLPLLGAPFEGGLPELGSKIMTGVKKVGSAMSSAASSLYTASKGAGSKAAETLKGVGSKITSSLSGLAGDTNIGAEGLRGKLAKTASAVGSKFSEFSKTLGDKAKGLTASLATSDTGLGSKLTSFGKNIADKAKTVGSAIVGKVKDLIPAKAATTAAQSVAEQATSSAASMATEAAQSVAEQATSTVTDRATGAAMDAAADRRGRRERPARASRGAGRGGRAVSSLGQQGGVISKLGGLGSAVGSSISGLLQGIATGFAAFANPATAVGAAIFAGLLLAAGKALQWAAPAFQQIAPVLVEALRQIVPAISAVFAGIGNVIVSIGEAIAKPITAFGDALSKIGQSAPGIVAASAGVAILAGAMGGLRLILNNKLIAKIEHLGQVLSSYNTVPNFRPIASFFYSIQKVQGIDFETIGDGVVKLMDTMSTIDVSKLTGIGDVTSTITPLMNALKIGSDAVKGLSEGFNSISIEHFNAIAKGIETVNKSLSNLNVKALEVIMAAAGAPPVNTTTGETPAPTQPITAKPTLKANTVESTPIKPATPIGGVETGFGTVPALQPGTGPVSTTKTDILLTKVITLLERSLNTTPNILIQFDDGAIKKLDSSIRRATK